jgi:hypothetical protein
MRRTIILIVLLAFGLAACQPAENTAAPEDGSPATSTEAAPVITSQPGTATLSGILYQKTEAGQKPYTDMKVYLGTILKDTSGQQEVVARVNRPTAPQGSTDATGRFQIYNIPPGRYVLAVLIPPQEVVGLRNPETGEDLIIELAADQALDLGELEYDFMYPDYEESVQPYPLPENEPTAYPAP